MKILVVNNLYPPNAVGGYERLVAQVASGLARRGHRVVALTSDYGNNRAEREELPVERSLKLLTGASIYQPFAGSADARAAINRENRAALSRKLEAERPDVVLVGNLYFFDGSILDALQPVAERTVYLLTDVWRIHFANPAGLQEYFQRNVFDEPLHPDPPLAGDGEGLRLERIESLAAHEARSASSLPALARRRAVETELSGGRAVYQVSGTCHLCGPTVFTVRSAGPATAMLGPRARAEATCSRCGLDAITRGALHALDVLAQRGEPARVLVVAADPGVRHLLAERYPRCMVAGTVDEAAGAPGGFAHALCLQAFTEAPAAARALQGLAGQVAAGGYVLAGGLAAEVSGGAGLLPPWDVLQSLPGAALLLFWSREYGYLGRDYALGCLRPTPR